VTARELNPKLFLVARQNDRDNDALFEAARLDLVMQRSRVLSRQILALIADPLLSDFLALARKQNKEWAQGLIDYLRPVLGGVAPDLWTVTVTKEESPAVEEWRESGKKFSLLHLLQDPYDREQRLQCIPLLLQRGKDRQLLPSEDLEIQVGDGILFCGRDGVAARQFRTLHNRQIIHYLVTGETLPEGAVWRRFVARKN
jgi:hypothetical protein